MTEAEFWTSCGGQAVRSAGSSVRPSSNLCTNPLRFEPKTYSVGVDSSNLTPTQAARVGAQIGRHLRYLNRLCARVQQVGFPPNDPLFYAAMRARNEAQGLSVACHYASCTSGVGRASKPTASDAGGERPE